MDPEVQDFRSQVLGNELLTSVEEIEQWILRQWEAVGIARFLPLTEPGAILTYTTPDNRARSLMTRRHGVLFQLSELTLRLQWRYHWKQSEATSFILVPGFCPSVAILWNIVHWTLPNTSPRAMWRIELMIDPILPPEEVAAAYRSIRKTVIPRKRFDPVSEKVIYLAEFAATRPKGKGLKERMDEWNEWSEQRKETYPEWEYKPFTSKSNFSTECGQALKRLLNPDYQFPGQQNASP